MKEKGMSGKLIRNVFALAMAAVLVFSLCGTALAADAEGTEPQTQAAAAEDEIFVIEGTVLKGLTDYGKTLTHIDIPEGITEIGNDALSGFRDGSTICLESVTIPDTVTTIDAGAFNSIPGLTEIVIPDSVTSMGTNCFQGCEKLASIKLSANLTEIPEAAFSGTAITSVTIPAGVTQIGVFAFGGSPNLEEVKLPKKLTTIGSGAFISTKLKEVTLPKSVMTVEEAAFLFCDGIHITVSVGSKLESFNMAAFPETGTITAPASLKGAFAGETFENTEFKWVDDSKSTDAMYIVTDGSNVILAGLTDYGKTLTHIDIPEGITEIGNDALSGYMDGSTICLESVTIPDTVTTIGRGSFCGIPGLTEIVIPDSVTSMGTNCFQGCEKLASIKLSANLTEIPEAAFSGTAITSVTIPVGVTQIGVFAFGGSPNLEQVTLPRTLTTISSGAFISTKLKEVALPKSVATVEEAAFYFCDGIHITVPAGSKLKSFNMAAFPETGTITAPASLRSTFVGEGVENTDFTWIDDSKSTDIFFIVTDGSDVILAGLTDYGKTLTHIDIPVGVTKIGDWAFAPYVGAKGEATPAAIESVTIPDTVTTIGDAAFKVTNLKSVVIPDSVTSMGVNCFQRCYELASVKLSANLTEIPEAAFGESGITSIVIPNKVTQIGVFAFGGTSSLEEVMLPEKLTTISSGAFISTSLKEVTLPKSVTTVEEAAFLFCDGIHVTVPVGSKLESFDMAAFSETGTITAPASLRGAFVGEGVENTNFTWIDDTSKPDQSPQTGDVSQLGLWMMLTCVSLCGIALIVVPSLKGKRRQ